MIPVYYYGDINKMFDEFSEFADAETLKIEEESGIKPLQIGIPKYEELPLYTGDEKYYELDALSWSTLNRFLSNPSYFKRNPDWNVESAGFELGTYIHRMLLEREEFEPLYKRAEIPLSLDGKPYRTGKKFEAAMQTVRDAGFYPYTDDMKETLDEIELSIDDANYRTFIKTKHAEVPLVETLCGVKCKGKVDAYDEEFGIIDLKTSNDSFFQLDGYSKYGYQCNKFGYFFELVFFGSLIEAATGLFPPLKLLAVQTKIPYQVCAFEIGERTVNFCREKLFNEFLPLWKTYQEEKLDCGRKILTL